MAIAEPHMGSFAGPSGPQSKTVRAAGNLLSAVFLLIAAINLMGFFSVESALQMTHGMAVLFSLYLMGEIWLYLRRSDALGLISPLVLAILMHFTMSYLVGITASYFEPYVLERHGVWLGDLDSHLAKTTALAMVAAFCLIRGYNFARPFANMLRRFLEKTPQLRRDLRSDMGVMVSVQVAYLLLVAYAINLGVFGLLSTPESLARHLSIQQYLNLALAAGTLSYFLLLLRYYEMREQKRTNSLHAFLILMLIVVHVTTGAISAFKSQIIYPFVIAGFAYFLATRRLPYRFIIMGAIALIIAYQVIDPYRSILKTQSSAPASAAEAAGLFTHAVANREQYKRVTDLTRTEEIATRFDLTGMTALAVDFVEGGNVQIQRRYEFQDSILLAPILAFVPRAIWRDKPIYSPGIWFNQEVRGQWNDTRTSVAMGAIGYLYITGGFFALVLGFFGFGMLQSIIFEGFARAGAGGLIVFLSVASTLALIPTSFGPAITGVIRMLPVAFVAQWILLKRAPRGAN